MATVRSSLEFAITAAYLGKPAMQAARDDFLKTRDELRRMAAEGVDLRVTLSGLEKDKAEIAALTAKVHDIHLRGVADTESAEIALNHTARAREAKILAVADTTTARSDLDKLAIDRTMILRFKPEAAEATAAADDLSRDRTTVVHAKTEGLAEATAEISEVAKPRVLPIVAKIEADAESQKRMSDLLAQRNSMMYTIEAQRRTSYVEIDEALRNKKRDVDDRYAGKKRTPEVSRSIFDQKSGLEAEAKNAKNSARMDELRQKNQVSQWAREQGISERSDLNSRKAGIVAKADTAEAKAKLDDAAKTRTARIDTKSSSLDGITSAAKTATKAVMSLAAAMATVSLGSAVLGAVLTTGLAAGVIAAGGAAIAVNKRLATSHKEAQDAAKLQAETAKRDLAQAYRDVSDTAIESAQKITAAQHEVQMADRQEEDARRSLTEAYRDARHELEDLQLQLVQAPINQRSADLAVGRAYQNLAELGKRTDVTPIDYSEALNNIDEAKAHADEVRVKNQQLQEDAKVAAQKGVEGNDKVIKGKEAEADATHQQQIARQDLANTYRETAEAQQKAAESVQVALDEQARAQSELAKTAKDANSAITQMTAMFADLAAPLQGPLHNAMESFKQQFMALKPVIQQGFSSAAEYVQPFTDALTGLMLGPVPGVVQALQNSQPAVDGFRDGMRTLGLDIGTMFSKMSEGSEGFGNIWRTLGDQIGKFLDSIGTFVGKYAGPASEALTTLLSAVNDLASSFLTGLGPVMKDLPGVANDVAAAMHDIGQILQDVMPYVAQFIKALTDGLAPILHTLSGPVTTTLISIFQNMTGIVTGLAGPLNAIAKVFGAILDVLQPLMPLIIPLAAAFAGYEFMLKPAVKAFSALKKEIGGVLTSLSSPWTAGLTIAGLAVTTFAESAGRGADAAQRLKDQAQSMNDAEYQAQKSLTSSSGATNDSVISTQAGKVDAYRSGMKNSAADNPGFIDKSMAGLAAIGQGLFGRGGGIAADEAVREDANMHGKAVSNAFNDLGLNSEQIAKIFTSSEPAFDAMISKLQGMGDGGREAADQLENLRGEWAQDATAASPVTAAIKDLADKNSAAANAIDNVTSALEAQRRNGLTVEDAQSKMNDALASLATNAKSASGAMVDNNGVIDKTTDKGRALYGLINDNVAPAWERLTTAVYKDAIQHGQTADQAQDAARRQSDAIRDSALQQIQSLGYTQETAQHLLDHYVQLSGHFDATMTLNVDQPNTALHNLQTDLDGILDRLGGSKLSGLDQLFANGEQLPQKYHPDIPTPHNNATNPASPLNGIPFGEATPDNMLGQLTAPGHAAGGFITGAGTGTSDSILSFLSNGEFVATAEAVRKYGLRFFEALNSGAINSQMLPRFATGGGVDIASMLGVGGNSSSDNPTMQLTSGLPDQLQKMWDQIEVDTANAKDKIGTSWQDGTADWKNIIANKFAGDTQKLWATLWTGMSDSAGAQQQKIGINWSDNARLWNTSATKFVDEFSSMWERFWHQTNDTATQTQSKIGTSFKDDFAAGFESNTSGLVENIQGIWNQVEGVFAKPVNGIIGIWNQNVAGAIPGLNPMKPIPGYASGGQPDGSPGYVSGMGGSREDKHLVAVSNREYIVNAEATSRNRAVLDAINFGGQRAAVPGYALGGMAGHYDPEVPGFSLGGIAFRHMRKAVGLRFADGGATDGSSNVAINRALSWASGYQGKPYNDEDWIDCSGFASGIYDSLLGRSPKREFTTTANFESLGFVRGSGGVMEIGVLPLPGQLGHMAVSLAGHHLESGGAHDDIRVDGPAAAAEDGQFPDHYYLPGALFNPTYTGRGANGSGGAGGGFAGMIGSAVSSAAGAVQNGITALFGQLTDPLLGAIPDPFNGGDKGTTGSYPKAAATKVRDDLANLLRGKESTFTLGGTIPTGDRLAMIDAALALTNTPPPGSKQQWEAGMNTLVGRESGWNTGAVNDWDSNAKAGNASKGLAQTTGSTFAAFAAPGHNNIFEGVDNLAASINYIKSTYHGIENVQQANANMPAKGYAAGTTNAKKGWSLVGELGPEMVLFGGGETVIPNNMLGDLGNNWNAAAQMTGIGLKAQAAGLNFAQANFQQAVGDLGGSTDGGFLEAALTQGPSYVQAVIASQQSGQLGKGAYQQLSNQIQGDLSKPPANPLDPGQEGVTTKPGTPPDGAAPQQNQNPLSQFLHPTEVHFHVSDVDEAMGKWKQTQREATLGFDPLGIFGS